MGSIPLCAVCGGNDRDVPCAYPGSSKPGCPRDKRLRYLALIARNGGDYAKAAEYYDDIGDHVRAEAYRKFGGMPCAKAAST